MRKQFVFIVIAMALLLAMVGIATAANVTQNITYQGVLTDSSGNPLNGNYQMTFKLYDVSSGGTALATSPQSVAVSKGLFTIPITFDSSFFDGRALWLGISVGADAEMTPRQELRPVPYALSLMPGAQITNIQTIVQDIQTKVNTLLTKLGAVQNDVTTIKSTTNTINNKLNAPPKPTSYVYFTGALCNDYYRKELEVDPNANVTYHMRWTNMGDNPAEVTFSYYNISWKNYYPPNEFWTATIQVQAHDETGNQYTLKDLSGSTIIIIKTTTNSPFVAPSMQICDMNGNRISEYNPGDFQKVEIYS